MLLAFGTGGCRPESDPNPSAPAEVEVAMPGAREAITMFAGIQQQGINLGDPGASSVVVEFSDLQCPFCSRFSERTLPSLIERFVRTGRVRMVFRNLAFLGPDSVRSARWAAAVSRQNHLWEFLEIYFKNQGRENSGFADDAFLLRITRAIPGVDVDQVMADRDSPEVTRQLEEAKEEAKKHDINAAPSFLVGSSEGELRHFRVPSFDPEKFSQALEAALKQ